VDFVEHVKENQTKNVNGLQNIKNQLIVKNPKGFLKNNTANMDVKQGKNDM
jgi:filamentous hemagglutinin family protein